ncbi:MAG TPA: ATP-binding protein [Polyangia bacterium]|jgi:signal transduction histidine kinase
MTMRAKLLFAQAPLAVVLALLGVVSGSVTRSMGGQSRMVLADNYRSVLAAERMKESLERVNTAALVLLAGHAVDPQAEVAAHIERFERELGAQEGNITEVGEGDATKALRAAWNEYRQTVVRYQSLTDRDQRDRDYFGRLQPTFRLVNRLADQILTINQDAMVRKVDRAEKRAQQLEQLIVIAVVLALGIGLFSSTWLTTRMLRPLGVVAAAVRRFGDNDLKARADVRGKDEIAAVAAEFNRMAERLERYRQSSLGELLQAEQAAQSAIDSLPDPILLLDAQGSVHGANTVAAKLLGIDLDRGAVETLAAAEPGVRAVIDRLRTHVLSGRGAYVPKGFEESVRVANTPEGERILLPRAAPIYTESGAVGGVTIVLQDATRLFRFDELKNNLVATVAHEFRTPLTSLRMALHLCTENVIGPLTTKQADILYAAREDCERLQVIVDELLNLSRIEAGQIDLLRRRVEPESLVSAAIDVHKAAAKQAQVTLQTEVFPSLPDVFVDPDRLSLVFTNLISNAIRYAPSGSTIVVRACAGTPAEGVREHRITGPAGVRFEVQDQGPGISREHQAGLFEKFFRVPGTTATGSGLGLFIARGLVQAHGGKIGVDSVPGQGSTFWFSIPAAPVADASGARGGRQAA